jgi:hypothetical protein
MVNPYQVSLCLCHMWTLRDQHPLLQLQKLGSALIYEAMIAASTQNLLPMVLGRTQSSGMDDFEFSPALQDRDKLDKE